jgi:predicted RNase H-like nuclease
MQVVGIDACRGKWLGLVFDDGRFAGARFAGARFAAAAASIAAEWPDAAAVAVDIPIGLPETPWREADRAARAVVGERRSSVFPTFPAVVLAAPTYDEAKAICLERGWPQPSMQSFGMRHRILEVAPLADADERIVEVHPEVSFRALARRPLPPKRTEMGAWARRRALSEAGFDVPELPFPREDVLDAAAAAWSAMRYARGEAEPLPAGHRDRIGAIWR